MCVCACVSFYCFLPRAQSSPYCQKRPQRHPRSRKISVFKGRPGLSDTTEEEVDFLGPVCDVWPWTSPPWWITPDVPLVSLTLRTSDHLVAILEFVSVFDRWVNKDVRCVWFSSNLNKSGDIGRFPADLAFRDPVRGFPGPASHIRGPIRRRRHGNNTGVRPLNVEDTKTINSELMTKKKEVELKNYICLHHISYIYCLEAVKQLIDVCIYTSL